MDVFNAFNKISREKLFPFKKILEIKKGDIFRVYSLRAQSSPWGPKIFLNCDDNNFSIGLPNRLREQIIASPEGIDGVNKILKETQTYVYYETPQSPILTTNPNYRGLETEENPPNKPKRRGPAKTRKPPQEKVTDTFEPLKKKRTATKSKAAKKLPPNPYLETEATEIEEEEGEKSPQTSEVESTNDDEE